MSSQPMHRIARIAGHIAPALPQLEAAASSSHNVAASASAAGEISIGLSTHVLNTSNGLPAGDMLVTLQRRSASASASAASAEGDWTTLASDRTNSDGRISSFPSLTLAVSVTSVDYRLVFSSADYFASLGISPAFFPEIALQFRVDRTRDAERKKLHVPLLLSPFGYSTYRGS